MVRNTVLRAQDCKIEESLDMNDAAAVKAVFDSIDEAVNTINISFVMTAAK